MVNSEKSEVKIKVFTDDLMSALRNIDGSKIWNASMAFQKENIAQVIQYFNKNIQLTVNGTAAKLNYIGYEEASDAVFITFQIYHKYEWKSISCKGTFLSELFPSQINVFKFQKKGQQQFMRFEGKFDLQRITF